MTALTAWEAAARHFEPRQRRWASPMALATELDPLTVRTPALDLIDAALVDMADGRCDRLMVLMAPQEGKSSLVSKRLPTWLLADVDPDARVAVVSYEVEIARRWGADIKLDAKTHDGADGTLDLGLRLRQDSQAAGRWQLDGRQGGLYCVGIGGPLTGRPVSWLLVDDPLKDLEQAQSPAFRERAKRWWQSVAIPRLGPGSRAVLVQTRWNEDDLAGWLLRTEPDRWRVISIPAVAESVDDPLGRLPGEAMISARGDRDWKGIREQVGEYVWAALYQQRPAPAEGGLFHRAAWKYWTPMGGTAFDLGGSHRDTRDCWRFITVDLAASTKTSADWTVAAAWAFTADRHLILLDRVRAHAAPGEHWTLVRTLCDRWRVTDVGVESSMASTILVRDATTAGIAVFPLTPDTDKFTRALPAAARVDAGKVWLPAGALWLDEWVDELAAFPNAAHDDQVDVFAYAVNISAGRWNPGGDPVLDHRPTEPDPLDRWDGGGGTDLSSAEW